MYWAVRNIHNTFNDALICYRIKVYNAQSLQPHKSYNYILFDVDFKACLERFTNITSRSSNFQLCLMKKLPPIDDDLCFLLHFSCKKTLACMVTMCCIRLFFSWLAYWPSRASPFCLLLTLPRCHHLHSQLHTCSLYFFPSLSPWCNVCFFEGGGWGIGGDYYALFINNWMKTLVI